MQQILLKGRPDSTISAKQTYVILYNTVKIEIRKREGDRGLNNQMKWMLLHNLMLPSLFKEGPNLWRLHNKKSKENGDLNGILVDSLDCAHNFCLVQPWYADLSVTNHPQESWAPINLHLYTFHFQLKTSRNRKCIKVKSRLFGMLS